tara:strand:- start:782 stop:1135 length:354 start_codon:yes stop_codon:yes gene_type:complete
MISLKKILYEVLNNYSVEVDLFINSEVNTYDILNEIRALKGVTIVSIITPEDYIQKTGTSDEYIRLKIKFVTKGEANDMLQQFLDDALATSPGPDEDNIRIQGVKSMKYREKTLKKL